ncbi:MAG: hypothetical protein ACREEO_03260 [Phenylobacterium sp.]
MTSFAAWKTLVLGAFVAFMAGGIAAVLLTGAPRGPLDIEVRGASFDARKIELAAGSARLRLTCAGACDDLSLKLQSVSDPALAAQVTAPSGRTRVFEREATDGRIQVGASATSFEDAQ